MTSLDPTTGAPLPPTAIQRILYLVPKVHIYRIPPLTSTKGFNAASWTTNPADLLFTARLRILETAVPISSSSSTSSNAASSQPQEKVTVDVLLEDPKTGDLFAACPYTSPASVQQALDSSRFFAVRVVGQGNMKATLGIGFEERSDAFDFSVALQDARRVLGFEGPGMARAPPGRRPGSGGRAREENGEEKRDFRLKEGEMITVSIGGKGRRGAAAAGGKEQPGDESALFSIQPPPRSGGAVPFLPPPPSAGEVKAERRRARSREKVTAQDLGFDDGGFGEFQ